MLRETNLAATDAARLDHVHDIEFVPDDVNLGAELAGAPAEIRAAAVQRSRRLPEPDTVSAAWRSLPANVRDQIGGVALAHHFYALCHQKPDRALTLTAGNKAAAAADVASEAMDNLIIAALPELYGTDDEEPAWVQQDALALAFRVGTEAEQAFEAAAPGGGLSLLRTGIELHEAAFGTRASTVHLAIARHRVAWDSLQTSASFLAALNDSSRTKLTWPAEEAEDEAATDLLMLSCRSREDAAALRAHLLWYLGAAPRHPKRSNLHPAVRALIGARMGDLALALESPVAIISEGQAHGPIAAAIEAHRTAWGTYRGAGDWTASSEADAAAAAVLAAPCGGREDAEALVGHARWYAAELEAAGERLSDGFACAAQEMAARAGDLALYLSDGVTARTAILRN